MFVLVINGRLEVSVHDDRYWHFVSLVCESQLSLLVRQVVLIALIDEFSMYLYFVIMNGFARSEEVITEPTLHVSRKIFILRIASSYHAMLEVAQVFDIQEMLWMLGANIASTYCAFG